MGCAVTQDARVVTPCLVVALQGGRDGPIILTMAAKSPTQFERRVVDEYLVDYNKTQAYRRAGGSAKNPSTAAWEILNKPDVQKYLHEQSLKIQEDIEERRQEVIDSYRRTAFADVSEFAVIRRINCRYCHGEDHKFQYSDGEWDQTCELHQIKCYEADLEGKPLPPMPDWRGGTGFKKTREPHPDCPECDGEGVEDMYVKPTSELSPAARSLFAGIKRTKDGIEIKMNSQDKAREMLGRHLNVFEKDQEAGAGEVHIHFDDKDAKA